MAAKGTQLPRAQVRKMMNSARETTQAMREAEADAWQQRLTDPLERAKTALRRSGIAVFSHSQHVPGSTLIVVGNRTMKPDQVIKHAERFGRW